MLYNIAKSNKPRHFSGPFTNNFEVSGTEINSTDNNFGLSHEGFEPAPDFRVSYHSILRENIIVSLVAGVSDKYTGLPLNNVSFIFIPLKEDNNEVLEKETTGRGQFMVNKIEEGIFKVYIKKPGYSEQSLNITVRNNLTLFLEVLLDKE
jgi:hypothetical protein